MVRKLVGVVFSGFLLSAMSLTNAEFSLAAQEILSSKGSLPITLEEAPKLFKQCSRITPKPAGPYWLPSSSVIAKLEVQLTEYLVQAGFERWRSRWHSGPYRGQYVGFMQEAKKFIYASYSRDYIDDHFKDGEAIVICDGGPSFWGIVYDLEKEEFSDLQTNGR